MVEFFTAESKSKEEEEEWLVTLHITNLPSAESHHQISDERVLRFTTTMWHHHSPPCFLRHLACLDGLRHAANLVDLEQQGVAGLLVDAHLDTLGVGHQQVISATDGGGGGGGEGAPLTEPVTTKQSMFKNSLYITAWSPSTWGSEL